VSCCHLQIALADSHLESARRKIADADHVTATLNSQSTPVLPIEGLNRAFVFMAEAGWSLRVEPVVSHRLPHSPVLAQLRHTVLRGTASLHSRRYPWGLGYRRSDLRVSDLLLPHGSVLPPTAPFPTPWLLGSRSPAFARYYKAVKTPTALLPSLCSSHCAGIPWVGLAVSLPEADKPTASRPGCC
jgi:hypothetical protein